MGASGQARRSRMALPQGGPERSGVRLRRGAPRRAPIGDNRRADPRDARGVCGAPLAPGSLLDRRAPLERLPPGAVVRVPADGLLEAAVEVDRRAPAELALDLRGVEEVAPVVPRPVGPERLQGARLVEECEDPVGELLDRRLEARPDVVGPADPAVA